MKYHRFPAVEKFACGIAAIVLATTATPALAKKTPFPNKQITLISRGDTVTKAVTDIFTQAGLKVKISSRVSKNKVMGKWTGSPAQLWGQFSKTFNLVSYYDGSVVRIYHASEITSKSYPSAAPAEVIASAKHMGLTGPGNSVKAGKGAVVASGVPAFLDRVAQLAVNSKPAPPAVAAVPEVTPVKTAAVTPKKDAIVGAGFKPGDGSSTLAEYDPSSYKLKYDIMSRSTKRNPYEVRVYYLKYASASDKPINVGDVDEIMPGIASQLQAMMGDGLTQGANVIAQGNKQLPRENGNKTIGGEEPNYYNGPPVTVNEGRRQPDVNGPRISAHPTLNAVLVRDRPQEMSTYDGLIRSLDRPKSQIEIEAVIMDIDVTKASAFGIDFDFGFSALGGLFGGQVLNGSGDGNVTGTFVRSPTQFVNARINLIKNKGFGRVVQRPRLMAKENEPAVSDNRQRFFVRVEGERVGTVQEFRFGTFLKIRPGISREADRLIVQTQIDVRDGKIIGFLDGGDLPVISESTITTTADVPQGESLIIGGLTVEETSRTKEGLPIIGTRRKNYRRFERVVIITPRVLSNRPSNFTNAEQRINYLKPVNLEAADKETRKKSSRKRRRSE